jgi:hypothetical protein
MKDVMTEWFIELGPKPTDAKVMHNGKLVGQVRKVTITMEPFSCPVAKIEVLMPHVRAHLDSDNIEIVKKYIGEIE